MARTSKKKMPGQTPPSRQFRVGIYARLSVDGSRTCNQAWKNDSIDTQIALAKQYLDQHPEMELYDCYTDLGKTGTDFKREGFERMMQDVRKRRIDCVVVKDLSRFGRNHIETGNYIQKIFPFMGVRFIALADGIDTFRTESGDREMTVNLKNLVNEMYARDIAEKVRSSRRISQEQGSYTGGVPPYGYRAEWVSGKRRLVICPETSVIVREIYELFLSGKTVRQIAKVLYERGIHRPGSYRRAGHVYRQEGEILEEWSACTVRQILTNPVYTGCLVHDNGTKYHTHEPVVSEEVFFRAASIFEKQAAKCCNKNGFSRKVPVEEDIYAGILFCGDCGKPMARVANVKQVSSGDRIRYYGYHCPSSRRADDLYCPAKGIGKGALDDLVKTALHRELALSKLRPGRLVKECERQGEEEQKQIRKEIIRCGRQQESAKKRGSEWYLKYRTGSLSLEEFGQWKKENEKSLREVSERGEELRDRLDGMERELKERGKFLRNLMSGNDKAALTKEVIHTLVSRIDVYAGHRVKITFAFRMNELFTGEVERNGQSEKGRQK